MECKIIKQWIDLSLDDLCSEEQTSMIKEHLLTCVDCKNYSDEVVLLDHQLNNHFSTVETRLKTSTIMKQIKPKNKTWVGIAISAVLILSFTFNNQLYALAEKLPLVGDLLTYFSQDEGVKYAEEHGYPLYDMVFESEGNKMYIRDFYVDEDGSKFKIALETKDGYAIPSQLTIKSDISDYTTHSDTYASNDPWMNIDSFLQLNLLERNTSYTFVFKVDEIYYRFKDVVLEYDKPEYETRSYDINKTVHTEYGDLEIISLEVHPGIMFLNTKKSRDAEDVRFYEASFDSNTTLSNYNHHMRTMNNSNIDNYEFEPSIFYEDLDAVTLNLKLVVWQSNAVGTIDLDTLKTQLNFEDDYTLTDLKLENDVLSFELLFDEPKRKYGYPNWTVIEGNEKIPFTITPSTIYDDQFVEVPNFILDDWFGLNIDYIDEDLNIFELGREPYEDFEYKNKQYMSIKDLEHLIESYAVKEIDLDDYFGDNNVLITTGELEKVIGYTFETMQEDDDLRRQSTIKLLKYLYETYDYISNYQQLVTELQRYNNIGIHLRSEYMIQYEACHYEIQVEDLETLDIYEFIADLYEDIEPIIIQLKE